VSDVSKLVGLIASSNSAIPINLNGGVFLRARAECLRLRVRQVELATTLCRLTAKSKSIAAHEGEWWMSEEGAERKRR